MSEEVHVPHQHGGDGPLAKWVAIFTAIAATLGGIVGHEASHVANDAILYKNEAVLKKTDASNQWAYYQAVSTKSHLMELAKQLTPSQAHPGYDEKLAKYAQQKDEIQAKATALEKQVAAADARSAALREPRQNLFLSLALFQIAISVASVTVLSRQRWLFGVAMLGALGGIGFWALALLH
jgi:Domain of unknown function (DUF4337)